MLKPMPSAVIRSEWLPAAFRRLCVETSWLPSESDCALPAAFRRLCVETTLIRRIGKLLAPAAFRRLCVETRLPSRKNQDRSQPPSGGCVLKRCFREVGDVPATASRLQAAVC